MKTIILNKPGQLELIETVLPPRPGLNVVQARVRRVGICGTDLHAFRGVQPFFSYPRILGHELALEVLEIGASEVEHNLNIGDLCCLRPYLNCGMCGACLRGYGNCCVRMQVLGVHLDGGMSEVINIPIDKLHKSAALSEEELALVEMLSIGCHAVRRAQVVPGETVMVIGMGPIGLGVALFAHLAGARVIAADISDARLAFAARQQGIEHTIDAKLDMLEQVNAILPHDLPTVIFDATGSAQSMMKSLGYTAHGGRVVFAGLVQGDLTFSDPEFHRRELSLLASRNATAEDFRQVISVLEAGRVDVRSWITHQVSPEQLVVDFASWLDPKQGVIKAMLHF
ncbi:MAG: zinc-binding alcohol dehydrogenase family protein [Chloroflexota bacterium]